MSIDNVADIEPRIQYVATAAQVAFDYPYPIFAQTDLAVDVDGVTKAITTDYTVSGVGADTGGTITFLVAMAGGEVVTIYRDMAIERLTDFQQHGPYNSASFNDELDRFALVLQELKSNQGRSLRFSPTAEVTSTETQFSPLSSWLEKFLYINANGIPEPATGVTGSVLSQSTVGAVLYPQTPAEASAGVTPTNYQYEPGHVPRYGTNTTPGTTDMTAAIQAALTIGGDVVLPDETCLVTAALNITKQVRLSGAGASSILLVSAGVGATTDIIYINPTGTGESRWYEFRDFVILPASGTPGRHAIHLDLTAPTGIFAQLKISRVQTGALGGRGFYLTNPTATDGFFSSVIEGCWIKNGLYFQRGGDSLIIRENTISGANYGVEVSQVNGASQMVVINNNITTSGGSVYVGSYVGQIKILFNQLELAAAYTGAHNALVVIAGDSGDAIKSYVPEIVGNNIDIHNNLPYCLHLDYASYTNVSSNRFTCDPSRKHINITANAVRTNIDETNLYTLTSTGLPTTPLIDNASSDAIIRHRNWSFDSSNIGSGPAAIAVGVNPATSGLMRIQRSVNSLVSRNQANSANVSLLGLNTSDQACYGDSTIDPSRHNFFVGGTQSFIVDATNNRPGADNTISSGQASFRWSNVFGTNLRPGAGLVIWTSGAGSPESAVTAPVGSLFLRTDGGAGTTFYVKESGTGNTGWVAK